LYLLVKRRRMREEEVFGILIDRGREGGGEGG